MQNVARLQAAIKNDPAFVGMKLRHGPPGSVGSARLMFR